MFEKIRYVFTKEYRDDAMYREMLKANADRIRLRDGGFDIDGAVRRLKARGHDVAGNG